MTFFYKSRIVWTAWIGFFVLLFIRGDGFFPLPKTMDPVLFRFVVLFQTILVTALSAWLIAGFFFRTGDEHSEIGNMNLFSIIGTGMLLIIGMHLLQARRFSEFGYHNNVQAFSVCLIFSTACLIGFWKKNKFLAVLSSAMILKIYPILSFPITSQRSDMIPILTAAVESLLKGENVYHYYLLDNTIWTQNVRFPGLIASFIPSVIFKFDPRFILIASEILFFGMVEKKWGRHPWFIPGTALLAFFPYWHYRHELYETPFWVLLLAVILMSDKKRPLLQILLFAVLISFHQWGILMLPFILIYLARQTSFKYAGAVAGISALLSVPIFALFCRLNFSAFFFQTFTYYDVVLKEFVEKRSFPPNCLYFTPEIARITGYHGLKILIYGSQAVLLSISFFKLNSFRRLLGFLAASLLIMILTNTVAWTYQYLLLGVLIWLGLMQEQPVPNV